ncbi:hypothetical protein ABIB73_002236 [Bradyrhizobium sp. F1.4.3]
MNGFYDAQLRIIARDFVAPRNDGASAIAAEVVIPVVIPAATAVAVVGNAEHALDRAYGSSDTGTDDTSDRAAYRAGDAVAFIRTFLGAAHDALGVARMRQARQEQSDSGACKEQAAGQTGRQRSGRDTNFVHRVS